MLLAPASSPAAVWPGVLIAFLEFDAAGARIKELSIRAKRIKDTFLGANGVAIPLALVAFGVLIGMLALTGYWQTVPASQTKSAAGESRVRRNGKNDMTVSGVTLSPRRRDALRALTQPRSPLELCCPSQEVSTP